MDLYDKDFMRDVKHQVNEGPKGDIIAAGIDKFMEELYNFMVKVDPKDKNFKAIDTIYNRVKKDLNSISDLAKKL